MTKPAVDDQGRELSHQFCCNPGVAICGANTEGEHRCDLIKDCGCVDCPDCVRIARTWRCELTQVKR